MLLSQRIEELIQEIQEMTTTASLTYTPVPIGGRIKRNKDGSGEVVGKKKMILRRDNGNGVKK